MSLSEKFNQVAEEVRQWKTVPSTDENLAMYSLYKQAIIGDVNIPEPSGLVEKSKFKAWSGRKGLSKDDAMQQYVDMADKLKAKYQ